MCIHPNFFDLATPLQVSGDPVALCVSQYVTRPAKTTERIDVMFRVDFLGSQKHIVLDEASISQRQGGGGVGKSFPILYTGIWVFLIHSPDDAII